MNRVKSIVRDSHQQELDLQAAETPRSLLPSPKRDGRRTKERRHLPWETNYAAFSSDFAKAAIQQLCTSSRSIIFDPFVGNGTTLEAAMATDAGAYGIELNPYSALLSRCRVSASAQLETVDKIFRAAKKARPRKRAKSVSAQNESYIAAESLLRVIASRANCSVNELVLKLCSQLDDHLDSELVALVAGLNVVKGQAAVHFRSNPAWLIRGHDPDNAENDAIPIEELDAAFWTSAELMIKDLHGRAEGRKRKPITVFPSSFQTSPIRSGQISRFLTSPPYLNRLDYVNPTLPELHALGWRDVGELEGLRAQMMGTTKMRKRQDFDKSTSATVRALLDVIASHPTKASGTYYLKFFRQYFEDLVDFFSWIRKKSSPVCRGIVVIQDSFYKEIRIPIVQIISELASGFGFSTEVLLEEKRSRHMGTLSPHQRAHAPDKALTEYTLLLKR